MVKRRNFYWDIRNLVTSTIEDLNEFERQTKAIDDKIKSGKYSNETVQKDLMPQKQDIKKKMEMRREVGCSAIRTRTNEYVAELRAADQLNPDNLTDDIKLLQAGVALSADDLTMLFDRNAGNSTMQKLIADYAKQHDRDIGRHYRPPHIDLMQSVDRIPEAMEVAIKWHNKPHVFDHLVGDGSDLDNFLRDE